jgi:hypothetical protein
MGLAMRVEKTPQYPYALRLVLCPVKNILFMKSENIGLDLKSVGIHNLALSGHQQPNNPVIGYRSLDKTKKSE